MPLLSSLNICDDTYDLNDVIMPIASAVVVALYFYNDASVELYLVPS